MDGGRLRRVCKFYLLLSTVEEEGDEEEGWLDGGALSFGPRVRSLTEEVVIWMGGC
jgi:hypothetical protein